MTTRLWVLLVLLLPGTAWASDGKAVPVNPLEIHLSFAPVVRKAAPAVVNIFSREAQAPESSVLSHDPAYRHYLGNEGARVENSLGSGVIVDPNGTIVTNAHVIRDSPGITVVLSDRREFEAVVERWDDRTDLAVLKIDPGTESLPSIEIRDSDELEVGDLVLAIGNPFGVGQTVTSGIVSALARTVDGINDYRTFIQTDAAINPGNSGGALVSLDGKLVGINTALYTENGGSVGIGFAIPTILVRNVLANSGAGHRFIRPWLGANGHSVTAGMARRLGLAKPSGMLVDEVVPAGPAARAGIEPGDVVLAVDGKPIEDEPGLRFRFATLPVGTAARLTVWRAGNSQDLTVPLQAPPETPKRDVTQLKAGSALAGVTVANLSPALSDELGVERINGVIVLDIPHNSPAQHMRLAVGDILALVDDQPIDSVAQLQTLLGHASLAMTLVVWREGRRVTLSGG